MPDVSKIVYKGKEIIYVDYHGCSDEKEMIGLFKEAAKIISELPKGCLVLINFEGAFQTPYFLSEARKIAKQTQKFVKKRAIVGMNRPANVILLNAFNKLLGKKQLKAFKTMKEAKEWLIK